MEAKKLKIQFSHSYETFEQQSIRSTEDFSEHGNLWSIGDEIQEKLSGAFSLPSLKVQMSFLKQKETLSVLWFLQPIGDDGTIFYGEEDSYELEILKKDGLFMRIEEFLMHELSGFLDGPIEYIVSRK